ncbi:MAG TPA: hypothetical protein VF773_08545 [Verrucomicrobiae bacterium]
MATTAYNWDRNNSGLMHSVRWKRALQAGLIVGAIMFLLTRGIPWVGSGAINPAVMGREVAPGESATPGFFFGVMSLHFLVAALYGLIIAPIVHGFKPFAAGAVGAVVGLVLYFISYALAGMLMEAPVSQREWPSIIIHVIFGIVCAEAYKGLARRHRTVPLM